MSRYDDLARDADECRKKSKDEEFFKENQFGPFKRYRITSEVEAEIENKIISESEVNSACQIVHDLVQVDFRNIAIKIRKVEAALTKDIISLNNKTFQNELEETAKTLEGMCNDILDFETQVRNRLPKVREIQRNQQIVTYFITGKYINYRQGDFIWIKQHSHLFKAD